MKTLVLSGGEYGGMSVQLNEEDSAAFDEGTTVVRFFDGWGYRLNQKTSKTMNDVEVSTYHAVFVGMEGSVPPESLQ